MRYFHAKLHANKRTGEGGVNIAYNQHPIRLFAQHNRFEAFHDGGCLRGVGGGTNVEMNIRLRQFEIVEERVRHGRVVVLTGMNNKRRKLSFAPLHRFHNWRNLHEVRPRTDNVDYLKH